MGQNIRHLRELKAVKLKDLALVMGLSLESVADLEMREVIDELTLSKVARCLDICVDNLKKSSKATAINYFNTFNNSNFSNCQSVFSHNYHCVFNPLDKVIAIYENLLQAEKEKNQNIKKEA